VCKHFHEFHLNAMGRYTEKKRRFLDAFPLSDLLVFFEFPDAILLQIKQIGLFDIFKGGRGKCKLQDLFNPDYS